MKTYLISISILLLACTWACDSTGIQEVSENQNLMEFTGPYLGASTPSTKPEPFRPELFSSRGDNPRLHLHSSLYFSKDGTELLFTNQSLPYKPGRSESILSMHQYNKTWSKPLPVSFSSEFSDQTGWFSPDGRRFYFGSVRPLPGDSVPSDNLRWWLVKRYSESWAKPVHISSPRSLKHNDGSLFIYAPSEDNQNSTDIYRSRFVKGSYTNPENLGSRINTPLEDYPVLVGPEEKYLIIYRTDPADRSNSGLYLSFNEDTGWTVPKRMGDEIGDGFDASLSPDGKYLFYLKRNDGIYWVKTQIIEYLRSENLNLVDSLFSLARQKPEALLNTFRDLRQKHGAFYNFDEKCLQAVFVRLALNGELDRANAIARANALLYPEKISAISQLFVFAYGQHYDSLQDISERLKKSGGEKAGVSERDLNRLGYIFMRASRFNEAVRIFKLNIELFPESYNTYDSYAESLARLGNFKKAIDFYHKSLELNPGNSNAVQMLQKLGDHKTPERRKPVTQN